MPRDGLLADDELGRDRPVRAAARDEPEHLELTRCQPARRRHLTAEELLDAPEVGSGSELPEHRPRRVELERGGVDVAEGAARLAHEHPGARLLVRRLQLLPRLDRPAQGDERRPRVAMREVQCPSCLGSHRSECRRLARGGDPVELGAGDARGGVVADLEHDLHGRREEAGPPRRLGRLPHPTPDRGRRGPAVALSETQERQPRLGLPPERAGPAVRLLRRSQLAAQAPQLALPVERLGSRRSARLDALGEAHAGSLRLVERLGPRPAELHHLGAVQQALTRVGDEVGLLVAPRRQHGGPLPGAADVVYLVAAGDQAAVDDARNDG